MIKNILAVAYEEGYTNAIRDISKFLTNQIKEDMKKSDDFVSLFNNLVLLLHYKELLHNKGE